MRFDTSMDSLKVHRSESVTDLNSELSNLTLSRRPSSEHARNEENFLTVPPKPFGIGMYHNLFLSLEKVYVTNNKYLQIIRRFLNLNMS